MPKQGPEGEGRRVPVMTRVTKEMRQELEEAAAASGRSLAQEVETRLEKLFAMERALIDAQRLHAEAAAARDAARIQAIRQAGFQIVREVGGGATVNVSAELLLAEADGILRSGFNSQEALEAGKTSQELALKRIVKEALEEVGLTKNKARSAA
jgi:coenzyme F420-reducing hydrogenase delta subunit